MNAGTGQSRLRFQLKHLMLLVAAISLWLATIHYWGSLAVILTSSLMGVMFFLAGIAFRMRIVAVIGGILLFAGPFLLGLATAMLNP